ncbi:MAG: tyrosine-type recombinase/integrase [Holosporales bacterium]|jgi:integrase/recombinase XerD|nr:tyrosine-type recombinase/integrase [Holosporales bacterium]
MNDSYKNSASNVAKGAKNSLVFLHILEPFLEMLAVERNAASNTQTAYRSDLVDFLCFCSVSDTGEIAQALTEENLRAYCAHLRRLQRVPATTRRRISALKQYSAFLVREGVLTTDPTASLEIPKKGKRLPRIISEKDLQRLFASVQLLPQTERVRTLLMFSLLYGSGLRVSELVRLQWGHIEANGTFLRILGKGGRERRVPLCSQSLQLFEEWKSCVKGVWIFPSPGKRKYLTRQRIFQILRKTAEEAGLDPTCLSPHVLRHAFATHLLERGVDLISLKKMLGHQDISTTEIYTHIRPERLAQTVLKYHPLAHKKGMSHGETEG